MNPLTNVMSQANQLQSHLTVDFNLDLAHQDATHLFDEGSNWVIRILRQDDLPNPLPVALRLIRVMTMDEIQLEDSLRYQISKTCRLFSECFAWQALQEKRPIYKATKDQFLESFDKTLSTLPVQEVATRYEIRLAKEAIKMVETEESLLERYGPGVAALIFKQSPVEGFTLLKKALADKQDPWFVDVLQLSWTVHAIEKKETGYQLKDFYDQIQRYDQIESIAFCALETLVRFLKSSMQDQTSLDCFFKGDHRGPGLFTFVALQGNITQRLHKFLPQTLGKTQLIGKADLFWTVRYRTLTHLLQLFADPRVHEEWKREMLQTFAARLIDEWHPHVTPLLFQFHRQQSSNPEWKDLIIQKRSTLQTRKDAAERSLRTKENSLKSAEPSKQRSFLQADDDDSEEEPILSLEEEQLRQEIILDQERLRIEEEKLQLLFGEEHP